MLLLLFINDLPDIDVIPEATSTGLYADDTKLFQPIRTPEDSKQLQHALSCTADWSNDCNLKFNSSKCKVLTVSGRKYPFQTSYHLGTELHRVVSEVDLGITVTSNLSWNAHIKDLVSKANKMLGLLRRTCPLLTDHSIRRTLYLSRIKSQLSYATQVWSPTIHDSKTNLENLERVQRRATRWILQTKKGGMSYKERLLSLNLLASRSVGYSSWRIFALSTTSSTERSLSFRRKPNLAAIPCSNFYQLTFNSALIH